MLTTCILNCSSWLRVGKISYFYYIKLNRKNQNQTTRVFPRNSSRMRKPLFRNIVIHKHVSNNLTNPMKKLIFYTIGFTSFLCCVNNKKVDSQKSWIEQKTVVEAITIPSISKVKNGVKFINTGPRGGSYINSNSTEIRYAIFRVQIVNDTIIPLNLELNFPEKTIDLLADSSILLNISIIPDSLTPYNIQNNLNFGVIGIEEFLESELSERYMLKTSIPPKGATYSIHWN